MKESEYFKNYLSDNVRIIILMNYKYKFRELE